MNVTFYDTERFFSDLRDEWQTLLNDSDANQIFLTHEWQSVWWESFHPGEIWALVVRDDGGRCLGIAPWFIMSDNGQRVVFQIGCIDVTDYLEVIARRGAEAAVFQALAEWVAEHADLFDRMCLCNIPQDSHMLVHLPEQVKARGLTVDVQEEDVCPLMTLPATFEDYVAGLDKKHRHELRRKMRRAAGEEVDWYIVSPNHDLDHELDTFLALMAASTPDKAGFLDDPQNTTFFRRMVPTMAEQGWLQLAFMTVQGEPAAAYLNFDYGNRIMVYNSGLDPEAHGHLSPGIVLLARLIEHAIRCKREIFDFLRGDEPYKYYLGGHDTHIYRMEIGGRVTIRRIAMLSVHTCPLATLGGKKTGGMNVYVRDLGRELGREGIQVDVFTRSANPDVPHVGPLGENGRVIHVVAGPEVYLESGEIYPYLPEFVENVRAFAAHEGITYDVIYSHYWLSGWVAHELRAQWGIPVIQMFHTLGRMKNRIAQKPTEQEADIRVSTETDIMAWADRLIAATPAERAQMLWLYRADRRKIEIVPPGVDLDRFHPFPKTEAQARIGVPPGHRMLLFVGRIEPLKGVENILRALALLRDQTPELLDDVCMCVIGGAISEGQMDAEITRLIGLRDQLGLGERVTFLGARDQDILQYYYCAAEALIMPSDYESFGMVALEAMACGTPVIASEVGGLAFLVEDGVNGFHVPTREPAALAERMRRVLTDAESHTNISSAARQTAQVYGWPLIAARLLTVFEDVCQTRIRAMPAR